MTQPFNSLNDRLEAALRDSPHLSGRNLRFESEAGRVILKGRVASFFQKQIAQETVKAVDEEIHIDNQLEVDWNGQFA